MERFNEQYFNGEAYASYRYDAHYLEFIKGVFSNLNHFNKSRRCVCGNPWQVTSFLDVGCALGYYVRAMKEYESLMPWYIDIAGIDVSEFALRHAGQDVQPFLMYGDIMQIPFEDNRFDLVLCKDVLEHIPEEHIDRAIYELKRVSNRYIVVGTVTTRVEWDKDETHINIKPNVWWMQKFKEHGLGYVEARFPFVGFWESVFLLEIMPEEDK